MRKLVTVLAMAALLGAVATAEAFKAGSYEGTTQWKKPVSFTASKARVTGFKIKVQYGCTDLDTFWTRDKRFPAITIGEDGSFASGFRTKDGSYKAKIRGTLTGKTAKGTYVAERTYNPQGELDPKGSITCHVQKTKWTAEKTS